jgi:hypothetical protein
MYTERDFRDVAMYFCDLVAENYDEILVFKKWTSQTLAPSVSTIGGRMGLSQPKAVYTYHFLSEQNQYIAFSVTTEVHNKVLAAVRSNQHWIREFEPVLATLELYLKTESI